MKRLTQEQIEEYKIFKEKMENKELIGICKCGNPFIKKEIMKNMCEECMKGIVIPSF